jgi:DNA-binding transcriptional LysR family regulator
VRGNFEVNSGQALYEAILAGLGIGRVIQFLSQRELISGQLVHLLKEYEEDNDVGVYAVFPSQRYLLPKVQGFVEFLAKSFLEDLPKA